MTEPRAPRSKLYDGALYGRFVEPILSGLHDYVADRLPDGERVLDACCGTGGLSRRLAEGGRCVVGVDLSPRNVRYARGKSRSLGAGRLSFEVADVSQLEAPEEGPYDVAVIVLALHEMPASARVPVLGALLRAARRTMIVDFAVPMPWNTAGVRSRILEVAAGVDHFSAFRDYARRGGVPALVEGAGAEVESERRFDAGTMHIAVVRTPT